MILKVKHMKRVTVWVDCRDGKVEDAHHELQKLSKSKALTYAIVEVSEVKDV